MPAQSTALWQRLSGFLARMMVRFWPDPTKQWGLACEAELTEITDPLASFRWLIGGVMLLTKEWCKSFFKGLGRPIGVPAGGPLETLTKDSTRVPRAPRWATVLFVLASAGILMHPEVRASLGSIFTNYTDPEWNPSHWSSVKKLRKVAETKRDPQLLALLSLLSPDDAERIRLSEEAIEKDPSLTWVDYEQSLLPLNDLSQQHYLPVERIERLQKWDPDNAVPHLLAAEVISHPMRSEAFLALLRNGTGTEWEKKIAQDSRWLAAMERTFSAPKYDSYLSEEFQLARAVTERYGIHDAHPTLYILMRERMVGFTLLRAYTNYLLERGAAAEHEGNLTAAASVYWQILRFSERISLDQQSLIEKFFATNMGAKAGDRLEPLLERTGHTNEAALVGFQLAEWHVSRDQ